MLLKTRIRHFFCGMWSTAPLTHAAFIHTAHTQYRPVVAVTGYDSAAPQCGPYSEYPVETSNRQRSLPRNQVRNTCYLS